jgi:hypothetical protein
MHLASAILPINLPRGRGLNAYETVVREVAAPYSYALVSMAGIASTKVLNKLLVTTLGALYIKRYANYARPVPYVRGPKGP